VSAHAQLLLACVCCLWCDRCVCVQHVLETSENGLVSIMGECWARAVVNSLACLCRSWHARVSVAIGGAMLVGMHPLMDVWKRHLPVSG
jgi:hypothetical protein